MDVGGAGLTTVQVAEVMEQAGASLLCTPLLGAGRYRGDLPPGRERRLCPRRIRAWPLVRATPIATVAWWAPICRTPLAGSF